MKGLVGKVAVVTGSGAGIGKATALVLAEYGCKIVVSDIDVEAGHSTVDSLRKAGSEAHFIRADISVEPDVVALMEGAVKHFGHLDILVNNAATFIMEGIDASVEDWQKVMSVNIMGYALCVKHAVPQMRKVGGGSIVNLCSISGFIAQPGFLTYNATKGAVANMTRCMAMDLAKDNIRVNGVCPGTIWTESNEVFTLKKMGLDRSGADGHPSMGGAHLLKRCGDPAEVAEAIAFLASDSASFVTAENLMVDGGYTAQ